MTAEKTRRRESDMYGPIRDMLRDMGFAARGEVKGCDIAALRGDELCVVETKLSANITLLYQAMERKSFSPLVFVAVPRPKSFRDKKFGALKKILEKLELGLILVSLDSPAPTAEIAIWPEAGTARNKKKAAAVTKEITGRSADTPGGSAAAPVNTAYRERCIQIACLISAKGEMNSRELRQLGCGKGTAGILRANHYGWFSKDGDGPGAKRGITEACRKYLDENKHSPLVAHYSAAAGE